jgi:hypothetical protein
MSKRFPKPLIIDMLHCIEFKIMLQDNLSRNSESTVRQKTLLSEIFRYWAKQRFECQKFLRMSIEIEWTKIIRSRHILTHEYDDVDDSIVWKIINIHLPPLKNSLQEILKQL